MLGRRNTKYWCRKQLSGRSCASMPSSASCRCLGGGKTAKTERPPMAMRQGEPHGHQETHQDAYARFVAGTTYVSCLTTRTPLHMCNKRATQENRRGTGAGPLGARGRLSRAWPHGTLPRRAGGYAHMPCGDMPLPQGDLPTAAQRV